VGKVPLSVYDFFAYLSSGAVILSTADYISGSGLLNRKDVTPILAVALIFLTYVLGQMIAHLSSWLLETSFTFKLLGAPSAVLMGAKPRSKILKLFFPGYYRPLAQGTIEQVSRQAAAHKFSATDESLFQHMYPIVTQNDRYQLRLDEFRNQYGFARNVSFAFLLAALALICARVYGQHSVRLVWAVLSALAAITLFYRYLKFIRQYSYELFLRYSQLPLGDNDE